MRDNLQPGDRVQYVSMPGELLRGMEDETPTETMATVTEVRDQTVYTGVNSETTRTLVDIETEGGQTAEVSADAINNEIDAKSGGETLIPQPEPSPTDRFDDGFFGAPPTRPTDIGREADGEFDAPDTKDDVRPAPIDRNTETGRFGIDPFDLTSGGFGDGLDLFGGDRK